MHQYLPQAQQHLVPLLQNLYHALLNNPINKKKQPPLKKNPKAVKDMGGGVNGMYDRGQRFNGFFLRVPLAKTGNLLFLEVYLFLIRLHKSYPHKCPKLTLQFYQIKLEKYQ